MRGVKQVYCCCIAEGLNGLISEVALEITKLKEFFQQDEASSTAALLVAARPWSFPLNHRLMNVVTKYAVPERNRN